MAIRPTALVTRPTSLIYGRFDLPPPGIRLGLALQHCAQVAIYLVIAVTVARMAGLDGEQGRNFVAVTMVAGGIGAILQAMGRFGIGSGYLVPPATTTILLPASAGALALGGLPLLLGMICYAGVVVALLSRVIHRLRWLFPPEIAGFVVLMVGLSVIVLAMRNFLGVGSMAGETRLGLLIASGTLALMVALAVWGTVRLRLFSSLIGIVIGCIAAYLAGWHPSSDLAIVTEAPVVSVPRPFVEGLAFDPSLVVPFTIAALAIALNAFGAVTAAQMLDDPDWKRPQTGSIGGGVLAEGLTNVSAGVLGGFGQAANPGAVGLSQATGANSRSIAFALGAILVALAFVPKLAALLLVIPAPIVGAALLFSACFLITSAIQMIASRMLDVRKVFVLGIAFALGIAAFVFPEHFDGAPAWLAPFVGSALSVSVASAVLLNLVFRIGIYRRSAITLDTDAADTRRVAELIAEQGASWAAPQALVHRAELMTMETVEALIDHGLVREGPIRIATRFDEFTFTVTVKYRGTLLEPSGERPTPEAILEETGRLALARYLVGRAADRAVAERQGEECVLVLTLRN